MDGPKFSDDHPQAVVARVVCLAFIGAVTVASLGPSAWLPHLLYSNNLEHFAAFYLVALAFCAARYRAPMPRVLRDTALLATLLEAVRWLLPGPRKGNFDHWMADLGGILAVAAPLMVVAFRQAFNRSAQARRQA